MKNQINSEILDIVTVDSNNDTLVFAVTDAREIISINFSTSEVTKLYSIPEEVKVDFTDDISLYISKDASMAAVVNTLGQFGIVLNLVNKTLLMNLDRGNYYVSHCVFPIAFFQYGSDKLMIHATN